MTKLLWIRKFASSSASLSLWCVRHGVRRFFRRFALAAFGVAATWFLHSPAASFLLFFEVPIGRSRGHTRRLHVSTSGIWLYDVERAMDAAV